jgi:putative transposase
MIAQAGLPRVRTPRGPSRKGTGFEQPLQPHQHWHIDVSYINLCGTFYYLCSILDGFSRFLVHWEARDRVVEMHDQFRARARERERTQAESMPS